MSRFHLYKLVEQLRSYIEHENGMSKEDASKRFWCLDKPGLLTDNVKDYPISEQQKLYVRSSDEFKLDRPPNLLEVVEHVHPTILIGCSTVPGAFTEDVVRTMAKHCDHPMIFPLSNPTQLHEAKPADLYEWVIK